jgi:hypothetical protein
MVPIIQVDNRTVEVTLAGTASVTDLLEAVQKNHVPEGMVIGSIYLNGVFWQPEWDAELTSLSIDHVEEVRLETLEPDSAAREGLTDLADILDLAEGCIQRSSDDLRFGNHTRGLLTFADAADLLRDALRFFALYAQHEALTDQHPGMVPVIVAEQKIAASLPAFETAQGTQDWALLADIIEYEVGGQIQLLRDGRDILDEYRNQSHLQSTAGVA